MTVGECVVESDQVVAADVALDPGRDRLTEELRFSGLTDCIIILDMEMGGSFRRTARVLKARNTAHSLDRREMEITASGVRIP